MDKYKGVRPSGKRSIEIDFYFDGRRCREKVPLIPTPANLARAAAHRAAILIAIDDGVFDYAATFPGSATARRMRADAVRATVGGWLNEWLDRKAPHIKASTWEGYRKAVTQLRAAFGALPLDGVTKKAVRRWCDGHTGCNKTMANLLSVFRAALQDAVDDERIDTNPLADLRFRRNEPPKAETVDPFTRDEQAAILAALTGSNRNLFQFAFWSGLRSSELVALEWADVDFERGVVRVERAKTVPSTAPETTKTRAGRREVKLLPLARAALLDQRAYTQLQGGRVFKSASTGNDFRGYPGLRRVWTWALKRAGVRYRKPYQTRHTFASMMLSAGEPLAWVSKMLGHSTVIMTATAYARWVPDAMPETGRKADELFGGVK